MSCHVPDGGCGCARQRNCEQSAWLQAAAQVYYAPWGFHAVLSGNAAGTAVRLYPVHAKCAQCPRAYPIHFAGFMHEHTMVFHISMVCECKQ
jgi:hypothetical protein